MTLVVFGVVGMNDFTIELISCSMFIILVLNVS